MKKLIVFVLALVFMLVLTACGETKGSGEPVAGGAVSDMLNTDTSTPETEQTQQAKSDLIPMVMVEGKLYLDTGKPILAEIQPVEMTGEITSTVDQSEKPTKDGQSNFGCIGSQYTYAEGGLCVLINDEWYLFEAEGQFEN